MHYSQKTQRCEWTKCPLTDKQNVVQTYNGYYSALKSNEILIHTIHHMDEPWRHYAKQSKPDAKSQTLWFPLCEVPTVVKFIDRK